MFFNIPPSSLNRHDSIIHLAHISDPHLPPPTIPWTSFLNKRLLSRVLWASKRRHLLRPIITEQLLKNISTYTHIRALLISGDLTNFGTKEEYIQAITWLKSLPNLPIVVPGNHDFMAPISHKNSLALWEEWSGKTFPFVRFFDGVAVVGLNSALPTLPFTAYGFINKKQRNNLAKLLAELGKEGYCRVVMLHHPPRKGLLPYRKSLINTHALGEILSSCGAELVLHGHSHDATFTTVENTNIPLLGVSAAAMDSQKLRRMAGWNYLSFKPDREGWNITVQRKTISGHTFSHFTWHTAATSSLRRVEC